jgi:hypothetical protein
VLNNSLDYAEERISKLKDRPRETIQSEKEKKKDRMKQSEEILKNFQDPVSLTNRCIIEISEEEKERGQRNNNPNFSKEIDIQTPRSQWPPIRRNTYQDEL